MRELNRRLVPAGETYFLPLSDESDINSRNSTPTYFENSLPSDQFSYRQYNHLQTSKFNIPAEQSSSQYNSFGKLVSSKNQCEEQLGSQFTLRDVGPVF